MKNFIYVLCVFILSISILSCTSTNNSDVQTEENQKIELGPTYVLQLDTETPIVGNGIGYFEIVDTELTIYEEEGRRDYLSQGLNVKILKAEYVRRVQEFEIIFLDENKEEMCCFQSTMRLQQNSEWDIDKKIEYGDGFVSCIFGNTIMSDIGRTEEEVNKNIQDFHDNMPKAKYFRVLIQFQQ